MKTQTELNRVKAAIEEEKTTREEVIFHQEQKLAAQEH